MTRRVQFSLLTAAIFLAIGVPVCAQAGSTDPDTLNAAAHEYFTDVPLITQDGKTVRLYSDLLQGKVVVINTFFGTCTGSCPKMSAILSGLQDRLGSQLGKDVFLLSFTVDPETDTPEKLKQYAAQFQARPGWYFLTGSKQNVDLAIGKLGPKIARKEDHSTLFLVGNNRTGLWKKVFAPSCTPASLQQIVESVLNDKE